jgi:hypothetical protein
MRRALIFILTAAVGSVMAGEITLTLKPVEWLKFTGCLTNGSRQTLYITPIYLREQFYAKPDCDVCPTGWVASMPMTINHANDFIPLARGRELRFDAVGCEPRLPWRISCFAVTNEVHADDRMMPKEQSIAIHSAVMPSSKK